MGLKDATVDVSLKGGKITVAASKAPRSAAAAACNLPSRARAPVPP